MLETMNPLSSSVRLPRAMAAVLSGPPVSFGGQSSSARRTLADLGSTWMLATMRFT